MARFAPIVLALVLVVPLAPHSAFAAGPTQSNGVLASFDGTPIVYTLFLPAGASAQAPAPVVIQSHGWGQSRQTTPTGFVGLLLAHGYAVLTFDERGFGDSGNTTQLMDPDFEVRDLSALISMLAARGDIMLDGPGDPRVGMEGVSYAGGIQTLGAEFDPRIDVIEPEITWSDLRYSLVPNGVPKLGWVSALFGLGLATTEAQGLEPANPAGPQTAGYDATLPTWFAEASVAGTMTPDLDAGLWHRAPAHYISHLRVPALFLQGAPDALFDINEGVANYEGALANGAPAKLVVYCGGHSGCIYDPSVPTSADAFFSPSDSARVDPIKLAWFDRYLKSDASVDTGPNVEWDRNDLTWHSAASWPPFAQTLSVSGDATLATTPAPTQGNGAVAGPSAPAFCNGAQCALAVRFPIVTPDHALDITGIGHATLHAQALAGEANLFFRLVDATSDAILDGESQPMRVGSDTTVSFDLVGTSYLLPAGHTLALEVTTADGAFLNERVPGIVSFHVDATIPAGPA